VDVLTVGLPTFSQRLECRGGLLVSVRSKLPAAYRYEMADPGSVCTTVPGWREAVVLYDPNGATGVLIEEARAWTSGPLERRCYGWVAGRSRPSPKRYTSWSRHSGRTPHNGRRPALRPRPPPGPQVSAVHRRTLYGSKNRLWDLVAEVMGEEEWHQAQSAALGLNRERFERPAGPR
jgi:hypothetical protein